MTETRQVIQVPGAPPISIRFGARPVASQRSTEAQQVGMYTSHSICPGCNFLVLLLAVWASLPVIAS